MRPASHGGTRPPCRGKFALPLLRAIPKCNVSAPFCQARQIFGASHNRLAPHVSSRSDRHERFSWAFERFGLTILADNTAAFGEQLWNR